MSQLPVCPNQPTNRPWQSLAPLRKGGDRRPLFIVHGLGGHVAAFMPLARAIAGERSVYGLLGRGLDPGQRPQDRVETMAACYLDEIRAAQPRGPYLLSGWSMGGLIALEMAHQLNAIDEEVALVAMIDTHLSMEDVRGQDLDEPSMLRWLAGQLNLPPAKLKAMPLDKQWNWIAEQAERAQGIGMSEIRQLAATCTAHLAAIAQYAPRPYLGPAVLFSADGGRGKLDSRWKSLCPQLRVERVPGDHYSMLREPAVAVLARRLAGYLQETANDRPEMRNG